MKINKDLIWDYSIAETDLENESFKRWYVARVLTNGTIYDLRDVGLDTVRRYLPDLWLPATIQEFWEWYFGLPHAHPTRKDFNPFSPRAA